jgi:hypothetical protein
MENFKMKIIYCLSCFLLLTAGLWSRPPDRRPNPPYITGDGFRGACDFIIDETNLAFLPRRVEPGDVIFVKTDFLPYFFRVYQHLITNPYILVTHNSDYGAPGPNASYLDDPKIIAWFAENVEDYSHPKLYPIPIGVINRDLPNGDLSMFDSFRRRPKPTSKSTCLYMNFLIMTCPKERTIVYQIFIDKPFCKRAERKDYYGYLEDMRDAKFALSPRGNGLDCYRTWEALYLGCIPVVKTSTLDELYDELPVVIVEDWNEVTEEFLNQKYEEFQKKEWNFHKLSIDYWFDKIASAKRNYLLNASR